MWRLPLRNVIRTSLPQLRTPLRPQLTTLRMAGNRDIFAMLSKKRKTPAEGEETKKATPASEPSKSPSPEMKRSRSSSPVKKKAKLETPSSSPSEQVAKTPAEPEEDDAAAPSSTANDEDDLAFDSDTEKKDREDAKKILSLSSSTPVTTKMTTNKPIPYSAVVETFDKIEATSSRLEIVQLTADFFQQVLTTNPQDLVHVTYLFINRLGPDYEGLELGLGEHTLMKTISEATGKSIAHVKTKFRETGDLGLIALQARNVQPTMFKPKPLTVNEVFKNLRDIAQTSGNKAMDRKMSIIKRMLTASQGLEAKFIIRSLEAKLRIGLAGKSVLMALAKAFTSFEAQGKKKKVTPEMFVAAEEKIRDAFCQVPNYEILINTALEHGVMNLDKYCTLKPGIPLKPMLAKPTKAITEVLDRFTGEEFTCEYKYDGERAQVHLLPSGEVRVYSRNSEDMSQKYPDIIDSVKGFLKDEKTTKTLILDCEAVAWSREENKILPFQVLSTRKKKDVQADDIKVQVCLFAFDILYYNEEPLIHKPLRQRREVLYDVLKPVPGRFAFATSRITNDMDELQQFLDESVKASCEGLMVKTLDSDPYRPSQRSTSWLKLKKDYLAGVGDSLDLVVVGAYYGRGKRTGTYGGFLLASYNPDNEEFETCCKIGTGFSDEMLKTLYEKLEPTELEAPKGDVSYDSSAEPDVWFEPTTLFEVLTADLSLSPIYKAGADVLGRGVSLRFPRFLRIRDDKGVEDATTSDQVVEFYERQAHQQRNVCM